jgi:hypothetical protein
LTVVVVPADIARDVEIVCACGFGFQPERRPEGLLCFAFFVGL